MLVLDHVMNDFNPNQPGEFAEHHYQSFETQRIDRWRQFLTPVEVKVIETLCREGMEQFGYAQTAPQVKPADIYRYYVTARRLALSKTIRRILRRAVSVTRHSPLGYNSARNPPWIAGSWRTIASSAGWALVAWGEVYRA